MEGWFPCCLATLKGLVIVLRSFVLDTCCSISLLREEQGCTGTGTGTRRPVIMGSFLFDSDQTSVQADSFVHARALIPAPLRSHSHPFLAPPQSNQHQHQQLHAATAHPPLNIHNYRSEAYRPSTGPHPHFQPLIDPRAPLPSLIHSHRQIDLPALIGPSPTVASLGIQRTIGLYNLNRHPQPHPGFREGGSSAFTATDTTQYDLNAFTVPHLTHPSRDNPTSNPLYTIESLTPTPPPPPPIIPSLPVPVALPTIRTVDDIPSDRLSRTIALILSNLCRARNPGSSFPSASDAAAIFYSPFRQKGFTLEFYCQRLLEYSYCSKSCFVVAILYIVRLGRTHSMFEINDYNVHRVLSTALVLAAKVGFHFSVPKLPYGLYFLTCQSISHPFGFSFLTTCLFVTHTTPKWLVSRAQQK